MALKLRVLGAANKGEVGEFSFYPGEDITLKLQVYDADSGNSFSIPESDRELSLTLAGTPTDITVADEDIVVDSDDTSIISTLLTDAQTAQIITGEIKLKIDHTVDANVITRIALIEFGLKKLTTVI